MVLSTVLLVMTIGSVTLLSRQFSRHAEATEEQARLVTVVKTANSASKNFGDLKYWLTDLAVSLLMRSERKVHETKTILDEELRKLEPYAGVAVTVIRGEVDALMDKALMAVDAYTNNERVIGNSLMAAGRAHIRAVDERLGELVNKLEAEAFAKSAITSRDAQNAVDISVFIVIAASVFGFGLTFLVLRSITVPLSNLVEVMSAITEGDLHIELPKPGRDEIGSMIRTLGLFRDSLSERNRLAARHKRAEKEIRDLAKFPEQSPNPTFRIDRDNVLIYTNAAGRPLLDSMGCAVGDPAPDAWAGILQDLPGSTPLQEAEFECGGRTYEVLMRSVPEAGYVNMYTHDITERILAGEEINKLNEELEERVAQRTKALTDEVSERNRAEAALRESENRFRDIVESSTDWIWEMDESLRFSFFSKRFMEVTGIDPKEFLGETRKHLGQNDIDEAKWNQHLADLDARQPFRDFCYEFVSPDGRILHFSVSGRPVFDEDGRFTGYRGIGSDISARVEAEERAQSAQEHLALAIENISESFVLFDAEDRIVVSNQSWRDLNRNVVESTRPGVRFEDNLRAILDAGLLPKAVDHEEEWLRDRMERHRNPGEPFEVQRENGHWILVSEQRLPDGGGVLIASDITERKRAEEALRESEARFRAIVDNSPTKIHIKDLEGRYLLINHLSETLFGITDAEARGKTSSEIFPAEMAAMFGKHDDAVVTSGQATEEEEEWLREDGSHTFLTVKFPMPDAHGNITAIGSIGTDITERKRTEERLRLLTHAIEQSSSMILITDAEGHIVYVNKQFETITGFSAAEVIGKTPDINQSGATDERTYEELWHEIRTGHAWHGELLNKKRNGDFHWVAETISPIKNDKDEITHFLAVKDDVTERKRAEAQIEHLALHDSLTNLPNRFLFNDRLRKAIDQSQRTGSMLGLLFLDLDDFKDVNDTLGHDIGDKLLKAVAGRLQSFIRDSDSVGRRNTTLARLGGDEFTVLLTNIADPVGAATVAERIIADLSRPFAVGRNEIHTGVSIGIAIHPDHGADPEQLLKNADLALYRSKAEGRSMYHFYSQEMGTAVLARKDLESELRQALDDRQLWLAYQPQVDAKSERMVGMEALLRWDHPTRGTVAPNEFIPIAEATGLIVPIGEWVLREACRQNKVWQDAGLPSLPVAVNLSAVQFRQTDLVATVDQVLTESHLEPMYLHLEITESVVMHDSAMNQEKLQRLEDLGTKVALDDFGTGYSSLSYLTQFPVAKIKLDSSFVQDIAHDTSNAAIVRAIVTLGHNLGMRVNVEGVETRDQAKILRSYGVDEIQGYLFSHPLKPDDVPKFLVENLAKTGLRMKAVSEAAESLDESVAPLLHNIRVS